MTGAPGPVLGIGWADDRGYKQKCVGSPTDFKRTFTRSFCGARSLWLPRNARFARRAHRTRRRCSAHAQRAAPRSASLPVERLICGTPQTNVPRSSIRGQQRPQGRPQSSRIEVTNRVPFALIPHERKPTEHSRRLGKGSCSCIGLLPDSPDDHNQEQVHIGNITRLEARLARSQRRAL